MRLLIAFVLCVSVAPVAAADVFTPPPVVLADWTFGFDFFSGALTDIGASIVDGLFAFLEEFMEFVEDIAVEQFGLDLDVDEVESQFDFAKDLSSGINEILPIWAGLSIIFTGVVAQWVLIIIRYVLGYFVGG